VDFAFGAELAELGRTVRQFLDKTSPVAEVRRLAATGPGYDAGTWHRMADELGLVGMAIPEAYGGAGAGFTGLGLVAQEMGRALFCGPFLSTAVFAVAALLETGDEAARLRWLPAIAAGELIATVAIPGEGPAAPQLAARPTASGDWVLGGSAPYVLDGHISDLILAPAVTPEGAAMFAVGGTAPGLRRTLLPGFDPTRKYARLEFSATPATLVGAGAVLGRVFDLGCVVLACEQVGVAERALDMARDYALLRTQFGRPIGSFQAIKHKLANVLLEVEAARSAAWYGLWAADADRDQLPVVASIAQATCSAAAYLATAENIQVHGGIGYTWEHPAHLYFRRATTSRMWLGDPAGHHERLLSQLGY
jgi:alkylation response protein AidB-like acyl-CoA dehydrogenase